MKIMLFYDNFHEIQKLYVTETETLFFDVFRVLRL